MPMDKPFDWIEYHKKLADRLSEAIEASEREWKEKYMGNSDTHGK